MAKQESDEHLWVVVFEYYPHFEFIESAQDVFHRKITKWLWVICQDGSIVSRNSKRLKIVLIIDWTDPDTLDSMNLLPKFEKSGFGIKERASWRAKVYDKNDPGWSDIVRIDAEGGFFLEGLNKAWDHFNKNLDELKRDVKKISASLKPEE